MGTDMDGSTTSTSKCHVAETHVSFMAQSNDPIPRVTYPRGSKDSRLFRPSSMQELLDVQHYKPVMLNCWRWKIPILCGQSGEDFVIIMFSYIALWSFILFFVSLLLKWVLDSVHRHTALWMMFWCFLASVVVLLFVVHTGQIERERQELKDKQDLEDQAEARRAI